MTCIHHWQIAPPTEGPTSQGVCKHCGAERAFPNVFAGDQELMMGRSPRRAPPRVKYLPPREAERRRAQAERLRESP